MGAAGDGYLAEIRAACLLALGAFSGHPGRSYLIEQGYLTRGLDSNVPGLVTSS
jgi:hypothetical protein